LRFNNLIKKYYIDLLTKVICLIACESTKAAKSLTPATVSILLEFNFDIDMLSVKGLFEGKVATLASP